MPDPTHLDLDAIRRSVYADLCDAADGGVDIDSLADIRNLADTIARGVRDILSHPVTGLLSKLEMERVYSRTAEADRDQALAETERLRATLRLSRRATESIDGLLHEALVARDEARAEAEQLRMELTAVRIDRDEWRARAQTLQRTVEAAHTGEAP